MNSHVIKPEATSKFFIHSFQHDCVPGTVHNQKDNEINKIQSMSQGELPIQREKQASKHITPRGFGQTKGTKIKMAIYC